MSLSGTNGVSAETGVVSGMQEKLPPTTILMLLTNAYEPDPRVRQEALSLIKMGCRVRLLAWDRDRARPAAEMMEGVEVERIFLSSQHGRGTLQILFYFLVYLRMFWRSWRTRFDVIHCHDLDTLPIGFMLGKLKGKPVVYDSHEIFVEMLRGRVHPAVLGILRRMENWLVRRIDLLITVGETFRQYFQQSGARKVVVVGNWKRLELFRRSPEENQALRLRLGIPDGALVVTCISHLSRDRKIEELLRAVHELPDVYAIVGGDGEMRSLVERWASNNQRIIYLGFVPAAEIPVYTCASDVIYSGYDPLHPYSRYRSPHKLFEALAAGKPVIASDSGDSGEIVRAEHCGIILPGSYRAEDVRAALQALQNQDLWATHAENARSLGIAKMNWIKAEEVLYREYCCLRRQALVSLAEPKPGQAIKPAIFQAHAPDCSSQKGSHNADSF